MTTGEQAFGQEDRFRTGSVQLASVADKRRLMTGSG